MNQSLASLSVAQLKRAVAIKEKIEALTKELSSILGATNVTPAQAAPVKARRKISAAGIARIKLAQKARWAKIKAEKKK